MYVSLSSSTLKYYYSLSFFLVIIIVHSHGLGRKLSLPSSFERPWCSPWLLVAVVVIVTGLVFPSMPITQNHGKILPSTMKDPQPAKDAKGFTPPRVPFGNLKIVSAGKWVKRIRESILCKNMIAKPISRYPIERTLLLPSSASAVALSKQKHWISRDTVGRYLMNDEPAWLWLVPVNAMRDVKYYAFIKWNSVLVMVVTVGNAGTLL